jgi:hypothetical protein
MFGQGSGGTIAILSASVDPRIKALDVLDPWGDWPDWLAKSPQVPDAERAAYLKPEFLAKVAPLDPVVWLPKLTDRAHVEITSCRQIVEDHLHVVHRGSNRLLQLTDEPLLKWAITIPLAGEGRGCYSGTDPPPRDIRRDTGRQEGF